MSRYKSIPDISQLADRFRLVENRINVLNLGADPSGVEDSTDAFQTALNMCAPGAYNTVYAPIGKYKITRTLKLPYQKRPNTSHTEGFGFKLVGDGIYDTGFIYDGTDYIFDSDHDMTEACLFQDFYMNHINGGGIHLIQGAHQMFERVNSTAVGQGKYGVYIQGLVGEPLPPKRPDRETAGYGAYMVSFRNCRFWQEQGGYKGTGVRVEDSVLCTEFRNCFFSRSLANYPHLELVKCDTVTIDNCAFERSEQEGIPEADPEKGRTEEMVAAESRAANGLMTAPLIKLDGCHSVKLLNCHAEWTFEAFVGIYGHTSGVIIDGGRFAHYAIDAYNPNKGYLVVVDDNSIFSRDIYITRNTYRTQVDHEGSTVGPEWIDNVGCVSIQNHYDYTPYSNANDQHERRSVPRIGTAGANILRNPSLYAVGQTFQPLYLELVEGDWGWRQLDYKSGVNVKQTKADGSKCRFRLQTVESMDKWDFYSFVIVGRNRSGVSNQIWVDIGGDTNDFVVRTPSGDQQFTQTHNFKAKQTEIVDIVVYQAIDIDILAMYIVPGLASELPYGSEVMAASKMDLVGLQTLGVQLRAQPFLPPASWETRGMILRQDGNGSDDKLYVCKRLGDGSFAWHEL